MDTAEFIQVLDAATRFVAVLAWPAVVLLVLHRFGPALKRFLDNLRGVKISGGGLEAQLEAAANLAAAAATAPPDPDKASASEAAKHAAEVVAESLLRTPARRARKSRILWVDDNPENNAAIRRSFEALGIEVASATSTEEALTALGSKRFDLVISDMGRPPDGRAGYTLLSEMRERRIRLPFLIFAAGGNAPSNRREARERGADGSTNNGTELFSMVMGVLGAA
jgi:CheY-like chemotaxis protein